MVPGGIAFLVLFFCRGVGGGDDRRNLIVFARKRNSTATRRRSNCLCAAANYVSERADRGFHSYGWLQTLQTLFRFPGPRLEPVTYK